MLSKRETPAIQGQYSDFVIAKGVVVQEMIEDEPPQGSRDPVHRRSGTWLRLRTVSYARILWSQRIPIAVVLLTILMAGAASAGGPTGGPPGDPAVTQYVALGGSYAAGVGNFAAGRITSSRRCLPGRWIAS